jgi:hypothetical protein
MKWILALTLYGGVIVIVIVICTQLQLGGQGQDMAVTYYGQIVFP